VSIVIDILDVPGQHYRPRERGCLQVEGQRTDDRSSHTLLVIHEGDCSWTIHGLGAPGVRLPAAMMVALAEKILARAW
jgi:hypothetical protein